MKRLILGVFLASLIIPTLYAQGTTAGNPHKNQKIVHCSFVGTNDKNFNKNWQYYTMANDKGLQLLLFIDNSGNSSTIDFFPTLNMMTFSFNVAAGGIDSPAKAHFIMARPVGDHLWQLGAVVVASDNSNVGGGYLTLRCPNAPASDPVKFTPPK